MFPTLDNVYDADIVIQSGKNIYMCYLGADYVLDLSRTTPITSQSCWRIVKIVETESEGIKTIRRLYPNGDAYNYAFAPDKIDTYTFEYRR